MTSTATPTEINDKSIFLFSSGIGLSILGYLNPLHSPIGHDFLVNVVSFIVIGLSIGMVLLNNAHRIRLQEFSISVYTWIALTILLCMQPMISVIRYADALIFPVGALILVAIASVLTTNVLNTRMAKRQFINQISVWLYVMLVLNFIMQVMQTLNYNIIISGFPVTRLAALADRMDGNLGQANHTAYAYIFGIGCIIYQMDTYRLAIGKLSGVKSPRYQLYYQWLRVILLALFAVAISLTKSRAVFLMLVAVVGVYFFSQISRKGTIKKSLIASGSILGVFAISYLVGGMLLAHLAPDKVDATGGMGRLVSSGVDSQRMALTHKAIMIIKDYPLTGIGWRNFTVGAIPHVDEMTYVTFSDNSHMVFTQIASELGIMGLLCLMPVLWLLLRSVHTRHSPESAMALAFVMATCIYACFEYPLWYFRFLVVFVIFLAMIEQKNYTFKTENPKLSAILGSVALVLTFISGYYLYQYWTHKYLFWYAHPMLQAENANNNKAVFGFLNYADMDLATKIEISPDKLPQKLALFDRVIVDESSVFNLVSYGQLLSFDGKYTKALNMFKTACRLQENKENCDNIGKVLKDSAKSYPKNFQTNYEAYEAWLKAKNLP